MQERGQEKFDDQKALNLNNSISYKRRKFNRLSYPCVVTHTMCMRNYGGINYK